MALKMHSSIREQVERLGLPSDSREARESQVKGAIQAFLPPPVNTSVQLTLQQACSEVDATQIDYLVWMVKTQLREGNLGTLRQSVPQAILAWRKADQSAQNRHFIVLTYPALIHLMGSRLAKADRSSRVLERWGEATGNTAAKAAAAFTRGAILTRTGAPADAIRHFERAKMLCDWELGNPAGRAYCSLQLAVARKASGDLAGAMSELNLALADAIESREALIYADCHRHLGTVLNRKGRLAQAEESYGVAKEVAAAVGDKHREYLATLGVAFCQVRRGVSPDFVPLDSLELQLGTALPKRDLGLSAEYRGSASALSDAGQATALNHFRSAVRLARESAAPSNRGEAHRALAEFWIERRDHDRGLRHLRSSRKLLEADGSTEDLVALDRLAADIAWLRGERESAIGLLVSHATRVSTLGLGYEHLLTARRIAVIAAEDGQTSLAREWWARTEFLAESCGAEPLLERWRAEMTQYPGVLAPETQNTAPEPTEAETEYERDPATAHLPPVDLGAHGIITKSRRLEEQASWIGRIAPTTLPVLVRGESGTGKELFARLVHDLSPRRDQAFLAVNCAALPGETIESELYGHRRGAFTGAINDKPGLFWLANGGTLFLDEIGEMSPQLQAKLLRTLETGELRRLGDTRFETVDVRVVAATNVDLQSAVEKGDFRKDLYFRLRGLEIVLPALRERLEDIGPLASHFLEISNRRLGSSLSLPPDTVTWLMGLPWPGNVRELKFTIEQAAALAPPVGELRPQHFVSAPRIPAERGSLIEDLDSIERARLVNALESTDWNQTEAAKLLGLSRTTFIGKMRRLGISRPRTR